MKPMCITTHQKKKFIIPAHVNAIWQKWPEPWSIHRRMSLLSSAIVSHTCFPRARHVSHPHYRRCATLVWWVGVCGHNCFHEVSFFSQEHGLHNAVHWCTGIFCPMDLSVPCIRAKPTVIKKRLFPFFQLTHFWFPTLVLLIAREKHRKHSNYVTGVDFKYVCVYLCRMRVKRAAFRGRLITRAIFCHC